MLNKLNNHHVKVLFLFITLVIIVLSGCKQIPDRSPAVYLVDINVLNKTDYKIDKLALYEKGENQEYFITESKEDPNGLVHFAISYNKDSQFYLTGTVNNKELAPFEFSLEGFKETTSPQTLYISLVDYGDEKIQLELSK